MPHIRKSDLLTKIRPAWVANRVAAVLASGALVLTSTSAAPPVRAEIQRTSPRSVSRENQLTAAAPNGKWHATFNRDTGFLGIRLGKGVEKTVWTGGPRIYAVSWSPDSRMLLAERWNPWSSTNPESPPHSAEIWKIAIRQDRPSRPAQIFSARDANNFGMVPERIDFGQWSPDSRWISFWMGENSESIAADGMPFWILDTSAGRALPLAKSALRNDQYQSWAPESSALVFTSGGDRCADMDKQLELFDVRRRRVRVLVPRPEQVPGIVSWSPDGRWIAYAAEPTSAPERNFGFSNPRFAQRRVFLLNPRNGESRRLNSRDQFQDGPQWSSDGQRLLYVERDGAVIKVMSADSRSGVARAIAGAEMPAPTNGVLGYYDQTDWRDLVRNAGAPH